MFDVLAGLGVRVGLWNRHNFNGLTKYDSLVSIIGLC